MQNGYENILVDRHILVVGLGSAGGRHAEICRQMGATVATVSRRKEVDKSIADYEDLMTALPDARWDLIILAQETTANNELMDMLAYMGFSGRILVEKPVLSCPFHREGDILVGYNLRFHPVITYAKDWVSKRQDKIIGAQFYVGQHLSDWRHGRDSKQTYSAHKEYGGGVLRDLSHELDLACWLLGAPKQVTATGGRMGDVTVDADDFWHVLAEHEYCSNVAIHLNCLDRPAKRGLRIWTADESFEGDLLTGKVQEGEDYIHMPMAPLLTYQEQLKEVFNDSTKTCKLSEGYLVSKYIEAIEKAADHRLWLAIEDI